MGSRAAGAGFVTITVNYYRLPHHRHLDFLPPVGDAPKNEPRGSGLIMTSASSALAPPRGHGPPLGAEAGSGPPAPGLSLSGPRAAPSPAPIPGSSSEVRVLQLRGGETRGPYV